MVTEQPTSTTVSVKANEDAKVEAAMEEVATVKEPANTPTNTSANTGTMATTEVPSVTDAQNTPETSSDEDTATSTESDEQSQPKEEESTQDTSQEVTELKEVMLFGVDVSHVGMEYANSRHHVVVEFRRMVKKLHKMMYHAGNSSVQEIAENVQAGINQLDERMTKTRRELS